MGGERPVSAPHGGLVCTGAFENHPHRGIETVTYMLEGSNSHYDNHGHQGVIGPGEALWMTAGRGLIHNEVPVDERPVHTLQLWVNLPRLTKMVKASVQELRADRVPTRELSRGEARVFSGASGEVRADTRNHASVTMVEVRLQPNANFQQDLPPDYNGFVVILEGAGVIGASATQVRAGQVAWLSHEDEASSVAFATLEEPMRAILFAGRPLREHVVAHGPFVMNSEAEIQAAFADFRRQGAHFGLD
ncbi:pirin-like C-terminal cupin domain-containing protein [Achromobacter xylosoxidans]